ncbi:hypothetical protein [Thalassomonas haliotis]|uniref:Uncharacterized protein n=1 Tax=Thalassomonas haliotis TaxID=485448 RepID=A0ABY7VGU2_9GAMM|nr:hypothetical protein [Thalassomonas haliotis]WDE12429.1 hypothetical protein H3N35_02790 [Thalassomonas haliotis]
MSKMISAVIKFFPDDGKKNAQSHTILTCERPETPSPFAASFEKVSEHFQSLGFTVNRADVNQSISGELALFNEIFDDDIELSLHPQTGDAVVYLEHDLLIPPELRQDISRIVIPDAPEYFL